MGAFYVAVTIHPIFAREQATRVDRALVDTGSEYTWVPRAILESVGIQPEPKRRRMFVMADGRAIERDVGFALLEVAPEYMTADDVVFGEPGDMILLGARTMEGLGCRVDPEDAKLVAAGPLLAAGNVVVGTKAVVELNSNQ